jgi:drug/metabolite transporter (DMT)-like permease
MGSQDKKRRLIGITQIAISGFSFGFLGVFGKLAFKNGLGVGELLSYRFLIASIFMALGLAFLSPSRLRLTLKDLFICAGLGFFGYAVFSTFYFEAVKGVSVAMASLLLYTYPILVALGARLFFKTRLTKAQLIALPLAFMGLAVLLGGDLLKFANDSAPATGRLIAIASGLASAVCYAGYILVSSRFQKNIDPLTSGFYVMLFAALGLISFHRPAFAIETSAQVAIVTGIALVCTVLPLVLFLSGLQKLGNTEASLLSTIEPVTAAAVGSLLLGESLTLNVWLGGTIVLLALIATVLGGSKAKPAEALE